MLTTRILAPHDYDAIFGQLPQQARVIVVEDEGVLTGRWVLMPVWHAEFLEIAPTHQGKTSVARRLYAAMRSTARSLGVKAVYTGATTDDVRGLLEHVGATKLPGDHYVWEMS